MSNILAGMEIANRAVDIGGKVVDIVEDGLDRNQAREKNKTEANVALAANVIREADAALGVLLNAAYKVDEISSIVQQKGPYGFIHRQALIKYNGMNAKLVWDYIAWNQLTIEILASANTSIKYSIAEKLDDDTTNQLYKKLLRVEGIEVIANTALPYHGSKVNKGAFAGCRISNYADKVCILDDDYDRYILLTAENVHSCRFIEEKFDISRMKTYHYYEIVFSDGDKKHNSYIRINEKYRKYLEKYVTVTLN